MPGEYLENRSAFDVAFELALPGGDRGIVGVETKYHEHCKAEARPRPDRLKRYREVAAKSGVFKDEALEAILGTRLQQIWLDHLLALSMLQHPTGRWNWVKFILIHPAGNPSYADAARSYTALLADGSTFGVSTIESLLDARVLPQAIGDAFRKRYLAV